jgi:hypothetical protein
MNYKQIVMKSIIENKENYTSYFSYFERQAKIAEQEMYKPTDFFDGCVNVIGLYKEKIISAYEKRYTENDFALIDYKKEKEQGHTIDEEGVTIQSHIDYIEKHKLFVKNRGYKTNTNFGCELDKDGNISQSVFDTKITLSWYEVEEIEQELLKAKQEILPTPTDSSLQQPLINLPDKVLTFLAETKCENGQTFIDKVKPNPLKWLQNKQLARELLTHEKIKGTLKTSTVEKQAINIFVDKDNMPLRLAKNKRIASNDSDKLSEFLATL